MYRYNRKCVGTTNLEQYYQLLAETVCKYNNCEFKELTESHIRGIFVALQNLTPTERCVLRYKIQFGYTYKKIAVLIADTFGRSYSIEAIYKIYYRSIDFLSKAPNWQYIYNGLNWTMDRGYTAENHVNALIADDINPINRLPKSIQNTLKRSNITSLDDERLNDPKLRICGLGKKKMEMILKVKKECAVQ